MKKLLILTTMLYLISCNNGIEPNKSLTYIDKSNMSERTQLFIPLAEAAWEYSLNQDSRELVYSEIEKQFDGEHNVLFKTMITNKVISSGRTVPQESTLKVENALATFAKVKEDGALHPQIYIPFYEEIKSARKIKDQNPIFIFEDGPPSEDGLYQGYSFEGDLLVDEGMISEEFASKNEVWVLSVNERVDSEGKLLIPSKESHSAGRLQHTGMPQFKGFIIYGKSNLKEDWIGGGAEVAMTERVTYDGFNYDNIGSFVDNNEYGNRQDYLCDVSRSCAGNNCWVWINNVYFMEDWWDIHYYRPYAVYSVFEYDSWPSLQVASYDSIGVWYRSWETPWKTTRLYRANSSPYEYYDGKILWKTY